MVLMSRKQGRRQHCGSFLTNTFSHPTEVVKLPEQPTVFHHNLGWLGTISTTVPLSINKGTSSAKIFDSGAWEEIKPQWMRGVTVPPAPPAGATALGDPTGLAGTCAFMLPSQRAHAGGRRPPVTQVHGQGSWAGSRHELILDQAQLLGKRGQLLLPGLLL